MGTAYYDNTSLFAFERAAITINIYAAHIYKRYLTSEMYKPQLLAHASVGGRLLIRINLNADALHMMKILYTGILESCML